MSEQLEMFGEQTSPPSTLSLLEVLAKTLVRLELAGVSKETEAVLLLKQYGLSENADQEFLFGKMLKGHSPQTMGQILRQSSKPLLTLGAIDLNGNCLIHRGFYPKIESESTLLDILQPPQEIGEEYFLSQKSQERLMTYKDNKHTPIQSYEYTETMRKEVTLVNVNSLHKIIDSED